jgi:hypothetical protein
VPNGRFGLSPIPARRGVTLPRQEPYASVSRCGAHEQSMTVTLRSKRRPAELIDKLDILLNQLANCRYGDAATIHSQYVTGRRGARQLIHLIDLDEVDRLVQTRRQWVIMDAGGRLGYLPNRVLTERRD